MSAFLLRLLFQRITLQRERDLRVMNPDNVSYPQ